ncbi:beta-galactosidase [uncultured Desulfobulbus sp.]|uniref:beta-galactosidase n=1 Tax=uncultured Desulfobulbus sp. TaxID=239745 RepID=UPI0029C64722|nr:beta-galactosidase [uncultured Desulfobulbus sp.]
MPTISYTALSDAAQRSGQLKLYDKVPMKNGSIAIGDCRLDYAIPAKSRAYDVIPIHYKLSQPAASRRTAISVVAYENTDKSKNTPLYDMSIPGDLKVKIEYLGSVSADYQRDKYIPLTADPKTPISPFPPFKRDSMVRSSTIREAHLIWFKVRITNTGNTILDPEGFGASFSQTTITKLDSAGNQEWVNGTVNLFERQLKYIYPGESVEQWVALWSPQFGEYNLGLKEGSYLLRVQMLYRYHKEYNWGTNIWAGGEFARLEVPIRVTKSGGYTPVKSTCTITDTGEKMPGYVNTFEEFMTSFKIFEPVEKPLTQQGTIYLQVAPWTKKVVIKLMQTNPQQISVAKIPVSISDETLDVKYNPKNVMVIKENGREDPVFVVQAMPGMRTGFQLGPYVEKDLMKQIREMKSLGVNLIANTSGGWWTGELTDPKSFNMCAAQYKYFYDVLAREAGMKLEGWSVYPPSGEGWYTNAEPLLGRKITYSKSSNASGFSSGVDMGDPIAPEVLAAWVKYQYQRWGDMWFKTSDGRVPVDIEDSWGWLRDDINTRYASGPLALDKFRKWVAQKYSNIENVNTAWKSTYKSFDEIDPQANQGIEGDGINYGTGVFNNPNNPFHDWSTATEDWDTFRTELRMQILEESLKIIRKTIPGAEWCIRSEGANLPIRGDGKSDDMHWRHVYYSQRRNAMVYDVAKKSDALGFYSDYTTLPYTEAEWRQAMREMVGDGIIPMFLPQFDHMRDILLNQYYGREYKMHYNLDAPSKGMMIHCLTAAYPWWKATYEEGGAPGIIWSDYLCDGFATETQKRELKLLREHFNSMKLK